jgi:hypothetical protein
MIVYKPRDGASFGEKEAQMYGERLAYLSNKNGKELTPIDVVKDGKSKNSPFHDYFEWENSKAGELYRLGQARNLIAHIVEVVVVEGKPTKQRSYFSVKTGGKGAGSGSAVYVPLQSAVRVEEYRIQLLQQLRTTLQNATNTISMILEQSRKKR